MKTAILIIMLAGQPPQVYLSEDGNAHIRTLSEQMPDADLYCIYAEYAMRPQARPW